MKNVRALLLLLCLSLIAIPSHAVPFVAPTSFGWTKVLERLAFRLGISSKPEGIQAKSTPGQDGSGGATTTSDGGACIDPDGRPLPCPRPKEP